MQESNIRKHMDEEMERIRADLLKLGGLAGSFIQNAVWALAKQDLDLARQVVTGDDEVDDLAKRIDTDCFQFIARYQPLAADLRTVSSAIHMTVDLERIADIGVNVAECALEIGTARPLKPLVDIPRMGQLVGEMVDGAMRAFLNRDAEAARRVCAADDEVDDLERQVFRELLVLMIEHPRSIEQATTLINVARNLERAGDHATNLGEHILFLIEGQHVKASSFRRPLGA